MQKEWATATDTEKLDYLKTAVRGHIDASVENAQNVRGVPESVVRMQRGQLLLTLGDALRHVSGDENG